MLSKHINFFKVTKVMTLCIVWQQFIIVFRDSGYPIRYESASASACVRKKKKKKKKKNNNNNNNNNNNYLCAAEELTDDD